LTEPSEPTWLVRCPSAEFRNRENSWASKASTSTSAGTSTLGS
jgi:hypothetical protein